MLGMCCCWHCGWLLGCWGHFGAVVGTLGTLGDIGLLLWDILVTVRWLVGALWRFMDALWGPCGGSWGHFGGSWGRFWRTLGALGNALVASRDTGGTFLIMFGHFVQPLRKHCKNQWFSKVLRWDSVHCGHTLGLLGTL